MLEAMLVAIKMLVRPEPPRHATARQPQDDERSLHHQILNTLDSAKLSIWEDLVKILGISS